ncbi:TRAM domain-containing protein [Halococcus sp. IIIV-5B]|uniref:TRAM domain-containing protein n=1 Tax=Halococcus sp. IIIV-5B TaxID=2321230 RepID=UPI001F3D92D5|nr:TRAM domain-containing protein [Halococcus sp. IIIV-5B]
MTKATVSRKSNGGYVLVIPGARPGDEVTVEIENARQNIASAEIHEPDSMTGDKTKDRRG